MAAIPIPIGEDVQISDGASATSLTTVCTLTTGFVVIWTDALQDGSGSGIFGQRFNWVGQKVGGNFRVNAHTDGNQDLPSVTGLATGGFVVTWMSYGQDGSGGGIYARRYGSDGAPTGDEFRVNSTTFSEQTDPFVTALDGGGFVVMWQSFMVAGGTGSWQIVGQRYDNLGAAAGGEFLVSSDVLEDERPTVTALGDGGFLTAWEREGQLFARRYDSSGVALAAEFRVNDAPERPGQAGHAATGLSDGGFVLTWHTGSAVFGQRYDSSGVEAGAAFRVNSRAGLFNQWPSVTAVADGGFMVTWMTTESDGSLGIAGRRFTADGTAVGNDVIINKVREGNQATASEGYSSTSIANIGGVLVQAWIDDLWTHSGATGPVSIRLVHLPDDAPPSLTATAANPSFTEAAGVGTQAAAVSPFSATDASTAEGLGLAITQLVFTVSGLVDGVNERISVDGTAIALGGDSSGITLSNGLSYTVTIAGGTATVVLSQAAGVSTAVIESLINGITYQNTSTDDPTAGNRIFTLTSIRDSGGIDNGYSDTSALLISSTVRVSALNNDPPALVATALDPTFTEAAGGGTEAPAVLLFSGTSVDTREADQTIRSLTFTVDGLADGGNERVVVDGTTIALGAGTSGTTATNAVSYAVTIVGSKATVVLNYAGWLSRAAVNTLVNGIAYQNTSDDPTAGNRTITLTGISDNGGNHNGGADTTALAIASTVTVAGTNDAPTTSPVTLTAFVEDGGQRVITSAELLVNAVDLDGDVLTVSDLQIAVGGGTLVDLGGGTWGYTPAVNDDTEVSFGYTISDGTVSVAGTAMLDLAPANESPTLTATAANPSFTEAAGLGTQAAAVLLFSGTSAGPVETDQTVTGLTFTVSGVVDGYNEQIVVDGTTITLGGPSSGTTFVNGLDYALTIAAGTATIVLTKAGGVAAAIIDTLVDGIAYQNTSLDDPTPGSRTVTLTAITDSGGTANGGSDTAVVSVASTVTVIAVNDAPISPPVRLGSISEDSGQRVITEAQLLVDAIDLDGDRNALTVTHVEIAPGSGGVLVDLGDGKWGYTPDANDDTQVSLSYTISDGTDSGTGTATFDIEPANDAPLLTATAADPLFAEPAGVGTQAGAVTLFTGTSVSTFEAGQTVTWLTFTVDGLVDGMDEKIIVDGTVVALGANSSGTTSFNEFGYGVTIVAGTATVVLDKPGGISPAALGTLIDGISYQNTNTDDPTAGGRTITLTEIRDNGGSDYGGSDTAALSIASTVTVTGTNDAPFTSPLTLAPIAEDSGQLVISEARLLVNAFDLDDDFGALSVSNLQIETGNGTLIALGGRQWGYTPSANDDTQVSFSYTISDGTDSVRGAATLDLAPVNDAPSLTALAANPSFTEAAGMGAQAAAVLLFSTASAGTIEADQTVTGLTFTVSGLVDGADEQVIVDGTTLTLDADSSGTTSGNAMDYVLTIVGGVATVVLSKPGGVATAELETIVESIAYRNTNTDNPTPGGRTVTLTAITDSGGGDDTALLSVPSTVTVAGTNDAPTSTAGTLAAFDEDGGQRVITEAELLANAADLDGDLLTVTGLQIASGGGTLVDLGGGSWGYTPTLDDDTQVSFSYTISDGTASIGGMATLDLTPANDVPTTSTVMRAIDPNGGQRVITQAELLSQAADADGDALTAYGLRIEIGGGTLVDLGGGNWGYTPVATDETEVWIGYGITDGTFARGGLLTLDPTADEGGDLALSFSNTSINAVQRTRVFFSFSGFDADIVAMSVTFTDVLGNTITATPWTGRVDLSGLVSGNVTSLLTVTDDAGNTASVAGAVIALDAVNGTNGSDFIVGTQNDDTFNGLGGGDYIQGFDGNDRLDGGADDDWLDGGTGADVLIGGDGTDFYYVDDARDEVFEAPGGGIGDTVYASANWKMAAGQEIERLWVDPRHTSGLSLTGNDFATYLMGGTGADRLTGGGADFDQLAGLSGNDRLDGGAGRDAMSGGTGDDTFYVDTAGDAVFEMVGEGTDIVYATGNWTATSGQEIEILRAHGTAAMSGVSLTANDFGTKLIGGAGVDHLTGGAGVDRLNGRAGADVMAGLGNDDFYYVDAVGDQVMESSGGGSDVVYATSNWIVTAGQEIEVVRASGTAAILGVHLIGNNSGTRLIGGSNADFLVGGTAADWLNGRAGADVLAGGGGNDAYTVETVGDRVMEAAGGGTDTVYAKGDWAMTSGQEIEILRVSGVIGLTLSGNELGNALIGGRGDDRLDGGAGDDRLVGRLGADIFVFGAGSGRDTVKDFESGSDRLDVSAYHFDDFTSLVAAMSSSGSNTFIALDAGNAVILNGVLSSQLRASDFIL